MNNSFLSQDIFNKSSPNIIIYGYKLNIDDYIRYKFGNLNSIDDKIIYQSNHNCKVFNVQEIRMKDYDILFNILKNILSCENYYSKYKQHIIIMKNYDYISISLQTKMRVILEKFRKTSQFMIVTRAFGSIINPLKSRCLCIRISNLTKKQKRLISYDYIKDKSYENRIPIYDKIYTLSDKKKIHNYLEFNKYIKNHENIYFKIYKKLNGWIYNNFNLNEIKEYSYNILKYNINNIHLRLCEFFITDHKYIFKQKFKIVKCLSDCEYEFKKSYRSIVHIEKMFIDLIYLLA